MSEPWVCNDCDWTGFRWSVDSHLRANWNHGCSPKPVVRPCPNCGARINARSLWCSACRTAITPQETN